MDSCATENSEGTVSHALSNELEVKHSTIHDHSRLQLRSALHTAYFRDNITSDNAENFIVIGLFATENKADNEHITQLKSQLQNTFNAIRLFQDTDSAVAFMKTLQQEKIFLIISTSLLNPTVIPSFQNLPQLYTIYVLCDDKEKRELCWLKDYRKVKGVFSDISSVCEMITVHKRKVEHDLTGLNFFGQYGSLSLETNNKQDGTFMCAQLFKELILQTEDQRREDIAAFARRYYRDNPYQLAIILEFENNYDPSQVITWYTRDTFLYRMVNKALRTQDHLTVYAFRLFIRNLHMKLALLQTENKSMNKELMLYRGQALIKSDFEKLKLNVGGLLSINTFFSTTEDRDLALLFTGGTIENTDTEAILFEIDLNQNEISSAIYASIDQFSVFQGTEKEYLFSMGTVFRIKSIDRISGSEVWNVRLTLTDDMDVQLENLTLHMRQGLQQCEPILSKFTKLMKEMGFPEKALHFYMKQYDIENNPNINDIIFNSFVGDLCLEANNYEDALNQYQHALKGMNEHIIENPTFVCILYNNIGHTYLQIGNLDFALQFHQRALELALSLPEPNQGHIAISYLYQGDVVIKQNKMNEALICYENALALLTAHLPSTHPNIAGIYNRIGQLYKKQEKIEEALEMYEKSLSILVASRTASHPSLSATHSEISRLLWILSRFDEALQHGLEALQIDSNRFHLGDPDIERSQDWVDFLRREIHDTNRWLQENSEERNQITELDM
jgi:tetratricopeptide (TPR) repeat protein